MKKRKGWGKGKRKKGRESYQNEGGMKLNGEKD